MTLSWSRNPRRTRRTRSRASERTVQSPVSRGRPRPGASDSPFRGGLSGGLALLYHDTDKLPRKRFKRFQITLKPGKGWTLASTGKRPTPEEFRAALAGVSALLIRADRMRRSGRHEKPPNLFHSPRTGPKLLRARWRFVRKSPGMSRRRSGHRPGLDEPPLNSCALTP